MKEERTNVMRLLDLARIPYQVHCYADTDAISGTDVAAVLQEDPEHVFKTLVTVGKSKANYVFIIPVNQELNLKKAAAAAGEKSIEMIRAKELLTLTGYIHGGCSPIGLKKPFPTFMEETAQLYDTVMVSAGKIGYQVELSPDDLCSYAGIVYADLT